MIMATSFTNQRKCLNNKWDSVFGANTLCEHRLKMLETIWPYVKDRALDANLPPITAKALVRVIHRRKTDAAPGMHGWMENT